MGRLRSLVAAGAIATTASIAPVVAASPASAFPSQCGSSTYTYNGGAAWCNGGTGSVRVVIGCQNMFGFWENKYGPWVGVGQGTSRAGCSWGYTIRWAGLGGLR